MNEKIYQLIKDNLTDDLRRKPWKGHPCPVAGHCYVASEVYFHLCGGKEAGLKPCCTKIGDVTHWWLLLTNDKYPNGFIIDITSDQFYYRKDPALIQTLLAVYNNSEMLGKGFLTKKPSKRAQTLIDRITLAAYIN